MSHQTVPPRAELQPRVVERRLGFKQRLDEYAGDWSIARYIEATETGDEAQRRRSWTRS